jgi:abortive infection bacteriophage resistance protein
MMIQTLSMGTVSKLFEDLETRYQKQIASKFGLDHTVLMSALHSLAYIRNLCAHHSRVWNRELRIRPKIPKQMAHRLQGPSNRLGAVILIIECLLASVSPDSHWRQGLDALLRKHPDVSRKAMGL